MIKTLRKWFASVSFDYGLVAILQTSLTFLLFGDIKPTVTDHWYPFQSDASTVPALIGMNDWLEAPAGKHGRVKREGDQLRYNRLPFQIWGINNTFAECAPSREMAEKRAAFYAKYGINSVRLHKYGEGNGWRGILGDDSFSGFDPEGLDRMDFFIAQLKSKGIYVKFSPSFGPPRLMPADKTVVPFLEEFGAFEEDEGAIQIPHSGIFYSHAIQDVHIQQMVNLLQHKNPYTGLTYAEDPAIWDLEIINEQSILFYTSSHALEQSPTLRRQVGERFSAWLLKKYGSEEHWKKVWGKDAIGSFELATKESLKAGTVLPLGNPYYWNKRTLEGSENHRRQRHLDTLEFLTMLQMEFYNRYVEAIRKTGYSGEISGSNWQAGASLSHFANLWTDTQVGTIDRHNYFGGSRKNPNTGEEEISHASMLSKIGSGMLSTGMQQVDELPFMLSEWIHVWPNEWGVEGPAIIGAYGMGLQGWDVSYMFQNYDRGMFSDHLGWHRWDVAAPHIMGIFPAISRQVLRGDVSQSEITARLNVHAPSLFEAGGFDFQDQLQQGYDDKVLQTDKVSPEALAAARVVVNFTESPEPTQAFDIDPFRENGSVRSSTHELHWNPSAPEKQGLQSGFFTIDTKGTLAIVGFAEDESIQGESASIELKSHFAAVYLTALGKEETLANADRLLITALARARNTGQTFSQDGKELLEKGTAPILMEPVKARIEVFRKQPFEVFRLDHDGFIDEKIEVNGQSFTVDTASDQTPYYLIQF